MNSKHSFNRRSLPTAIAILIIFLISSCLNEYEFTYFPSSPKSTNYQTKYVIIVVVDGLRYSEAWGDSLHQNIPRLSNEMSKFGVINTRFFNRGDTYTTAGHTNITTGIYQTIDNSGKELPDNPSIFQYWNQVFRSSNQKSWVIASKDKLAILADCKNTYWKGKYNPSVNCGVDGLGLGSGYREDSLTLKTSIEILVKYHPNLVLINFRDPDYSAHKGNWSNYIQSIRKSDEYLYSLWKFLQSDKLYQQRTTLFVTSDHGRHLDSVADGFRGHGDGCEGCRHLEFFATGPDFKQNLIQNVNREQIDIPATIAELLGFELPNVKGKVMNELFNQRN